MGVSNENMGVSNENLGSPMKIWDDNLGANENMVVSTENLGVSNETSIGVFNERGSTIKEGLQ